MEGPRKWVVLEMLCWVLASMIYIISMATKYWKAGELTAAIDIYYNLFGICFTAPTETGSNCVVFGVTEGEMPITAPRVLMIFGLAFALLGAVTEVVCLLRKAAKLPRLCAGASVILGGILICVAGTVFANLTYGHQTFAYSFYLAWLAGVLYLTAGTFVCLAARTSSTYDSSLSTTSLVGLQ